MKVLAWLPDHSSHHLPHHFQLSLQGSLLLGFFLACYRKSPRQQLHFKDPEFSRNSLCSKKAMFGQSWVKRSKWWSGATFTWNNNGSSNFIYQFKQIRGTGTGQNCQGVTHLCIMHWAIQKVYFTQIRQATLRIYVDTPVKPETTVMGFYLWCLGQ